MKKEMRLSAIFLLLTVIGLCFVFSGFAWAEEVLPPPPPEIMSREAHQSIVVNILRILPSRNITDKKWVCGITNRKDGTVAIMGQTDTYGTVEYLDAKIYLQRWNGSKWADVINRTYSNNNSSSVSGSSNISVEAGYYRVRGVHSARNSGNYDFQSSVSEAIWIP